jgi:pilus assembly protein CpaD
MTVRNAMRVLSLFAVMLAGSCASPMNTTDDLYDPEQIHPITVTPSYESLKVSFATQEAGLMPDDEAHFTAFVQNYIAHGHGAISVSAPDGAGAQDIIHYFGDRIAEMGVQPSRILVGTHPLTNGDDRVELGYVTYVAHTDPCGDWTDNVAITASNLPPKNFGCATQHNLAVMAADPRDLEKARPMGAGDAERRSVVMGKYEQGQPTAASKTGDQQVNVSGVQ